MRTDTREFIREIFGDHQKAGDSLEPSLHEIIRELIDRVKGLELDARAFVQPFKGDLFMDCFDGVLGPAVAVGIAGAHFLFPFKKYIVDRPGVDRKALDLRMFLKRRSDARFYVRKERVDIPHEMPVFFLDAVGEAVDFLRDELPVLFVADDVPTAGCTDVDRKIVLH